MAYRSSPYDAKPVFFRRKGFPGYERAGYEQASDFVKERGMNLASRRVLEEHIQRLPDHGAVWARELLAYPEPGVPLRRRDISDVSGWVLPLEHIPGEALGRKGIALAIEPAALERRWGKTAILPARVSVLEGFPQEPQLQYNMPLDLFRPDGETAARTIFRLRSGGIRPILMRIYGGRDHISVDYAHYAPFAIAAEVALGPHGP
ncbi:MAG: hypothetical protein AB1324_02485 [Candidatus Micrarchaeota archaeon]